MTSFHVSHAVSKLQVRPDAGLSFFFPSRGFPFVMEGVLCVYRVVLLGWVDGW